MDEIIELYKRDVDRTRLRENLELTAEQRVLQMLALQTAAEEFASGRVARPEWAD